MQEGSFLVVVSRQTGVPNWLPFRKLGSDSNLTAKFEEHLLRAQRSSKELFLDAGVAAAPLTFSLPGAFGIALQETQQAAGGLGYRRQPTCFSTKRAAIFFQGYLSNVDELKAELHNGRKSDFGSSHGSDSYSFGSEGDQGLLSAELILQMYLQNANDQDKLPMLLSDLQGEYSFVIYDSAKRQAFAARDPNGREQLYVNHDAEGGMAFSNTLADPIWGSSNTWQEILPGHFCGGKNSKQFQQFALTPLQLRMREYAESLDDLSASPMCFSSTHSTMSDFKIGNIKDDSSPVSNRSSLENQVLSADHLFRMSI